MCEDLVASIPIQEIFDKIAIKAVRKNEGLEVIRFLMEDCKYDFKEIYDPDHINILQEACLYNAVDIVKYLLEKGFNPNTQDNLGGTPIHRVVHTNNNELISLLHSKGADLNVKEKEQGFTPLHIAALNSKENAISKLIGLGAKARLRTNDGANYRQLSNKIGKGTIKVESESNFVDEKGNTNELRKITGKIQYYKSLLDKGFSQDGFKKTRELLETGYTLENGRKEDNPSFLIALVNCFIISSSIKPKMLNKYIDIYLKHLTKTYNIPKTHILNVYFHLYEVLKEIGKYEEAKTFLDLAIEILNSLKEEGVKDISVIESYNYACSLYLKLGLYTKAEEFAKIGLNLNNNLLTKNDYIAGLLYFNLGHAQHNLLNTKDAYNNFEKAFSLVKDDNDIFHSFFFRLLERKEYDRALEIASKAKFKHNELSIIYVKLLKGDIGAGEALKEVSNSKYMDNSNSHTSSLDIQTICYHQLGKSDLALSSMEESFDNAIKQKDIDYNYLIVKYLSHCTNYGFNEAGLKFIEKTKSNYQDSYENNYLVKIMEALTYVANSKFEEAITLADKLSDINVNHELLTGLYISCACLVITQKDFNKYKVAQDLLRKILEKDPLNDASAVLYMSLALFLSGKGKEAAAEFNKLDEGFVSEIVKGEDLIKEEVKEEGVHEEVANIEFLDPVKIHNYFQKQKQQSVTAAANTIYNYKDIKSVTAWCVNSKAYKENMAGMVHLSTEFYSDYYALIDFSLSRGLENQTFKRFQNALEKGVCFRKHEQNGIKFIKGAVIELKINDDTRLFTTKIYHNQDGKKLIIFDRSGDHKQINRIVQDKSKIEIIKVENYRNRDVTVYNVTIEYLNPMIQILSSNAKLFEELRRLGAGAMDKFIALGDAVNQLLIEEFKKDFKLYGMSYLPAILQSYTFLEGKLIKIDKMCSEKPSMESISLSQHRAALAGSLQKCGMGL